MRKTLLFYIVLLFASLGLVISGNRVNTLVNLPWQVTSALSSLLINIKEGGRSAVRSVVEISKIIEENERLKKENLLLKERLRELAFIKRENSKLRSLLKIKKYLKTRLVFAKVLSWTGDYWEFSFLLNKGRADGVIEGMAVIGARGIVGIVVKVDVHTSKAISCLDPKFAIQVEDFRSKVRGILVGDGKALRLKYILPSRDVKPGDILVSTGIGGIFPGGIVVAKVVKVSKSIESRFLDIVALPTDRLENNSFVILIGGVKSEH